MKKAHNSWSGNVGLTDNNVKSQNYFLLQGNVKLKELITLQRVRLSKLRVLCWDCITAMSVIDALPERTVLFISFPVYYIGIFIYAAAIPHF